MSNRLPNPNPENPDDLFRGETNVTRERSLECVRGVDVALRYLKHAKELDDRIRAGQGYRPLQSRFVLEYKTGDQLSDYHFRHLAVLLRPKRDDEGMTELDAKLLRFGLTSAYEPNRQVAITNFGPEGMTDYLLNDFGYESALPEDLLINKDLELAGLKTPSTYQRFSAIEFEAELDYFEPFLITPSTHDRAS